MVQAGREIEGRQSQKMCYQVGGRGEGTALAMTALQQGNKTGDGAGGGLRGGHVVMPA